MKKTSKLFKILIALIIAVTLFGFNTRVQAASISDIFSAAKNFISTGESGARDLESNGQKIGEEDFAMTLIGIGQLLVAIGAGTIIIVAMIMAIRWLVASPDQKAKLKQQLIGLVVAAFVIFGAVGIWNLVRGIMGSVETTLEATQNTNAVIIADNVQTEELS